MTETTSTLGSALGLPRYARRELSATRLVALVLMAVLMASLMVVPAALAAPDEQDQSRNQVDIGVEIPEGLNARITPDAQGNFTIDNAQFRWGVNVESNAGAFFGGCNWLQAGKAGNWGRSEVWSDDRLFKVKDRNVRIEKRLGQNKWTTPTWQNKCQDLTGSTPRTVLTNPAETGTQAEVVIDGGKGEYDAATETLRIEWEGSFTVVFYGGMTYWWATDPVLELKNGAGELTVDLGGYGADMYDLTKWTKLETHHDVPIATISTVDMKTDATTQTFNGLTTTPRYRGVKVDVEATGPSNPQKRDEPNWGSFPQEFVDFQVLTGQAGYWYTTGGLRDPAKPPSPITVSFDATRPISSGSASEVPPQLTEPSEVTQPPPPQAPLQNSLNPASTPAAQTAGWASPSGPSTTASYEPLDLSSLLAAMGHPAAPQATGIADAATAAQAAEEATTSYGQPVAAQDIDWLGGNLIPEDIAQFIQDHREAFLWALAGLLVIGAGTGIAFWRGWLVLPWKN
ncbi:HtaA domain-containing protein [Auritidibacter ignavus]|uniref:HtaA domain-containing protein n=1 Tax=Auritidibacter ignavus TaxID=678932 RepID=UPI00109CE325|nr:HtaA domain-containing protein [Auritidibacter ignavus]